MADRVVNVCGIDYSTRAIDAVFVDLDDLQPPQWLRYELVGADAWERTRQIRHLPWVWDDVLAVGLEEPRGPGTGVLLRVQGAILTRIPGALLVQPWVPSQWRKAVGLSGNASKLDVKDYIQSEHTGWVVGGGPAAWPQDAYDAYCIALATRAAISRETT